jgi:hypothetical protein
LKRLGREKKGIRRRRQSGQPREFPPREGKKELKEVKKR